MNTLELVFEYDGPVHGAWDTLRARVNGTTEASLLPEVADAALDFEVHFLDGEYIVTRR